MKILITGLCLSRNLGGPAMGLTLLSKLKARYPSASFTFAVAYEHMDQEKEWADRYGIEIVPRVKLPQLIVATNPLLSYVRTIVNYLKNKKPDNKRKNVIQSYRVLIKAFESVDVVIDMSGISYIGDGTKSKLEGLYSYSNYYFAKKANVPFVRFVQSFGPFDKYLVRVFAKKEFANSDIIFARGKRSAECCLSIIKDKKKVYAYPDIAILLEKANESWVRKYLDEKKFCKKEYIVLSPSAVIFNALSKSAGGSVGEKHLRSFELIADKLCANGENIFFLPHMYSRVLSESDRELCKILFKKLSSKYSGQVSIEYVEIDLDPMQAKSLISESKGAVVSRYHALVAALSNATPVVAVGWNIKYQDLMDYYALEDKVVDIRSGAPEAVSEEAVAKLYSYAPDEIKSLHTKNINNIALVEDAFAKLFSWIDTHGSH